MAKKKKQQQVLETGSTAAMLVPPALGGVMAAGTALAIRGFIKPKTQTAAKVYQWAPGIGAIAGAFVGGVASYFLGGGDAAAAAALTAAITGGSQLTAERLLASDLVDGAVATGEDLAAEGTGDLSAVSAEYSGPGMNAIMWEKLRGLGANEQGQGESVTLGGTINEGAMGTPPFAN